MDPEQENYEDLSEEEEEETPKPIRTQKKRVAQPTPVEQVPESRYVAYHEPEKTGIVDKETNQLIVGEVLVILTEILNKVDNIEKSFG